MQHYFSAVLVYAKTLIVRFFRDKTALFFTLFFPLIFLFVFGSIFRGSDGITFNVAVINRADNEFANGFFAQAEEDEFFEVTEVSGLEEAKEMMGRGQLDSIIEIPETFGQPNENDLPSGNLNVYFEEASPQTGQTVASVLQEILNGINREMTGVTPPLGVVQTPTATTNLSQFDYTFSGLLGFSLLSLGIFGLANQLPTEKKAGMLRRLRATPFSAGQVILSNLLYYGFIGMLSLALMMAVGVFLFDFQMRGSWLHLTVFVLIGLACMLGIGLMIGAWARNQNQAAPLTNLLAFPMMFLSGTFFPRFLMPEWLQQVSAFIPLTPIVDGIRYITTENQTLFDLGPELAIIAAWTVVSYIVAVKLFRWE